MNSDSEIRLERSGLQSLIEALNRSGYCVVGPTVRDGAIVYGELSSIQDLPEGWTDEQGAGKYRLKRRADKALFGFAVGPHSWKKYLFPPEQRLWRAERTADGFDVHDELPSNNRYAFIGVRSCELHAIAIQDKVFMGGAYVDPGYARRRTDAFIVAVDCGVAAATCFCVSMKTGPAVSGQYDIALTEVLNGDEHYFLARAGTPSGAELLNTLPNRAATASERKAGHAVTEHTASQMSRTLDTTDIHALLTRNLEHPRWAEVSARCINCANCTMACPTCFCSTVEDVTDLTGEHTERWRKWDSCFTMDFSHVHGGSVRSSGLSRYRQWMTHKLATWHDQFGSSGCVGCGRCITWCPVGIDLTEEAAVIRASDGAHSTQAEAKLNAYPDA